MNSQKKMSRREREKLAHRQEIIEAAERVFVKNGFVNTTIEQVAQEAEFSVGAIYKFFENKEQLCQSVVDNIINEFSIAFEKEILVQPNPVDALISLIKLRLYHVEKHGGFFRHLMELKPGARVLPDMAIPERWRGVYDEYLKKLSGIFQKAIDKGWIRKTNPLHAAVAMEGVINSFIAFWERNNFKGSLEERVQTIKDNFLKHILLERRKAII
jgi:AcrR family transcriptional regulator